MEPSVSTNRQTEPSKKKPFRFLNSKKVAPYVFVLPFIVSFLLLFLYPLISAVNMSFQKVLPGQVSYVGLSNYERVLNPTFYKAVANTSIYVLLTVIILVFVPLVLAVCLDSTLMKFKTVFRAALFLPALTSVIVAGVIFRMIFGDAETSIANEVVTFFGFSPIEWRYEALPGMFMMVTLASWRWIGVNILYYLAALQTTSKDLYEAADMDGANFFQKFMNVTFPALKPVVVFLSTITIINGFRMFEESFVFWETSSPGNIGLTVVGYIYQEGIQRNDLGFGAAVGVVLILIIFIISSLQLKLTGAFKKDE